MDKMAHWIVDTEHAREFNKWCFKRFICSECKDWQTYGQTKYCPNCGARMIEPQESEVWNGIHAQITTPKGTFEQIFNDTDDNDI